MLLSDKMKEAISKEVGIPYEQLIEMNDELILEHLERRTGKKITWPKGARIDGFPIMTMEEVNKKIENDYER